MHRCYTANVRSILLYGVLSNVVDRLAEIYLIGRSQWRGLSGLLHFIADTLRTTLTVALELVLDLRGKIGGTASSVDNVGLASTDYMILLVKKVLCKLNGERRGMLAA